MISGAKPGPSSEITISMVSLFHHAFTSTVARAIDGVLEDVADTVKNRRIACADRLLGAGHRDAHLDRDAEVAMRRHRLLDKRRELHAVERTADRRELGDLGENVAAALRLLAQRLDV